MIEVWVPGIPKAQPRPRAFVRSGKARVHDAGTAEGWKGQVALALRDKVGAFDLERDGTFGVEMTFFLPRPAAMSRKRPHPEDGVMRHTKKPDLDNLEKAVLDACTHLGIWHDDSQVSDVVKRKRYPEKGGPPGMLLTIRPLPKMDHEVETSGYLARRWTTK